jgi:hypothetical protein
LNEYLDSGLLLISAQICCIPFLLQQLKDLYGHVGGPGCREVVEIQIIGRARVHRVSRVVSGRVPAVAAFSSSSSKHHFVCKCYGWVASVTGDWRPPDGGTGGAGSRGRVVCRRLQGHQYDPLQLGKDLFQTVQVVCLGDGLKKERIYPFSDTFHVALCDKWA